MVKIKCFDIVIIVLLLALSVLPLVRLLGADDGKVRVRITAGDEVVYYPLDENREERLGSNGHTLTVSIHDGTVSVISSDCEDKICMQSGEISRAGSAIVCLPADTVIEIVADEEAQDAVAG